MAFPVAVLVPSWTVVAAALLLLLGALSWALAPPFMRLKGRHVLVLGANSDIGRACACHAAMKGARVSLVDYDEKRLDEVREEVEKAVPNIKCLQEMCRPVLTAHIHHHRGYEHVERAVKKVAKHLGPIDVLICADTEKEASLKLQDLGGTETWVLEEAIGHSLLRTFAAIRAALPEMKGNNPSRVPRRIAIVSSITALGGTACRGVSSCSQAALHGLAGTLQQELAPHNIGLTFACCPLLVLPDDSRSIERPSRMFTDKLSYETSDTVARGTLLGLQRGEFTVTFGPLGWLTSVLTSGLTPQPFLLKAVVEVLLMGLLRSVVVLAHACFFHRANPAPLVSQRHVEAEKLAAIEKQRKVAAMDQQRRIAAIEKQRKAY